MIQDCEKLGWKHLEYLEGDNIVCLRCGFIIRKVITSPNIEGQVRAKNENSNPKR